MHRAVMRFALAFLVMLLGTFAVPSARATSNPSYDSAMASCRDYKANWARYNNPQTWVAGDCRVNGNKITIQACAGPQNGAHAPGYCYDFSDWPFSGAPPYGDICKARPPLKKAFDGTNTEVVNAGCKYKLQSDDDKAVKVCAVWQGKQVCTGNATWSPTGEYTAPPSDSADPVPAPPKVCGGGSCYDPNTNQYCAVGDSGQVCVPGPSGKSGTSPSCATKGNTTLCAGSPPPRPPNPPVSDPPTQIAGSDNFSSQAGSGPVSNTTVNNYNGGGSGANNGASTGDQGAPSSGNSGNGNGDGDKKGDGTSASGGGDCNTPPIVEGSAALGMVARQQWMTRCQQPEWTKVSESDGDGYKVSDTSKDDVFSTQTDGLDKIDRTSWAGSTCPALPTLQFFGKPWLSDQDFFCRWLRVIRYALMFAGAFTAACILAAGGKS